MNFSFKPKLKSVLELKTYISEYPGFPAPGIIFRDINPLLRDYYFDTLYFMKESISEEKWQDIDFIAGIESRGFILASGLAALTNKGFVPIRKLGKLPGKVVSEKYNLEYGRDQLEMSPGKGNVLLVDDVLATGGTLAAGCSLCEQTNHNIVDILVLINLTRLNSFSWNNKSPISLINYDY
jgi:adenine phosphoribosyltransferase